ncbi:hypothetical protein RUM43_002842 [Polyplax serrata]|uniref:Uncharacterized protein n=1 Tax=Polyplax serrata TaxID=468196 RepID=A0AAN8NVH1_POLSC
MSFSKLMTLGQLKAIGVKDERWTIQDKLTMYKGVIRIYNREQKNQVKDTNVLRKMNYKKISTLRKEVKELHEQVKLCMQGDKSLTRRLLQNHRELQLTYMNMSLDVHLGDLQHIISAPDFNRADLKQQAITNAIQNYDVKFCAAKNIQSVYKRMLAILRKDQRYYEAILVTLQSDSNTQHKCLIRATEMGQLAMEEMANMKSEYTRLEKEVRANMTDREMCLKEIRDRLVDLREESQGLVRTESEFDIQMIQTVTVEEPRKKGKDMEQEIRELNEILTRLQDVTLVPNVKNILPSMLNTLRQKRRLLEELRENAVAFDDMLNKKNHADLMHYSLYHSGAERTLKYEQERKKLKKSIELQKTRLQKILVDQDKISNLSVKLRGGLQRLCKLLEDIKVPPEYTDVDVTRWPVKSLAESLRPHAADEEVQERPPINEEAQRLIHLIESKVRFLKLRVKEVGDPAETERAFVAHFKHVSEFMSTNLYPPEDVVEAPALIVDVVMEDSQVPNRMEIKARSQEIYIEATRNPFEVVEVKGRSKKGGKKKK